MRLKYLFARARGVAIALVACLTVLMQGVALAQTSVNVEIRYEGDDFVVDFSGSSWRDEVGTVVLLSCDDTETCSELERITQYSSYSFRRSGAGLYKLEFRGNSAWLPPNYTEVLWEQYVANITRPPADLAAAVERHAPLFSFHAREGYFPVSLDALFGQPIDAFDVSGIGSAPRRVALTCTSATIVCASAGTTASTFMARNGHLDLRLFLRPEIASSDTLRGSAADFPVYWFVTLNGTTAWVTYSVFYAYDDKRPEYVAFSTSEGAGDHAVDRESVSVRFSQVSGTWQPSDVVYAGHLPTQPNTFRGCADRPECTRQGALNATWSNGRTKLPWASAAKRGNRPIVYVADGSHAVLPAFGWYFLDVTGIGAPFNVTEPAGSSSSTALRSGLLTLLDLNSPAHSALKFSGYLINAPGSTNYRVFPFVRYPINRWAVVAGTEMASCASGDCRRYIHNLPLVTDLTPPSAVVGESTEFTLRGENLAPLFVETSNCGGLTVAATTAEEVRFRCTPQGPGAVSVAMRRSATDEVLETRTVPVVAAGPTGSPDLTVGSLSFSPTSVAPGGQTTVSFTIANAGTATANASTAVVRINQSTTTAGPVNNLATVNVASLAAGASSPASTAVTVPTTPGSYRVWVIADNGGTAGQDTTAAANDVVLASGTLTVAAAGSPDLVVQNISFSPTSVASGGQTTVSFTIANTGTAMANASTAVVRINQSTTTAGPVNNLATVSVASLAAGASSPASAAVTVPTTPGTYRVWVIADNGGIAGQDTTAAANDVVLASGTLTVTALGSPDLVAFSLAFSPGSVAPGGTIQVQLAVINQGTATAAASTAVVRINQSTTSPAGSNLASISVPSLGAGASAGLPGVLVTVPSTPGSYNVWVVLDNNNTAGQSAAAAANDFVHASGTLTVTAPGSPDLVASSLAFSPGSVAPGGTIQVQLGVINQGTATAAASTAVVRINQSTTSPAGSNLVSISVPSLGAGASAGLPGVLVTVPATPGSYNVWVVLDNNNTAGQSAAAAANDFVLASGTLTVTASTGPDLIVQNLSFTPVSVAGGGSLQVNFTLVNQGSSTASASTAVVRINQSSTSSTGTNLVTFSFPSMPAGSTSPASAPVTAPSTAGAYRVWVLADNGSTAGQGSVNEVNDIVLASATLTVTTTGTPDLVVQSLSFSPSNPEPGAGVQVNFTIANQGNAPALASTAVIRINTSSTSAAGANLATVSVGPMPAGSSVSGSGVVSAPSVNGTHYVWMIADNTQTAGQSTAGEANDILRASSALTIDSPLAWGSANPTFPASPQAATSCALPSGASPQDYVLQSGFKVYAGGCVASLTLSAADWSSMTTVANNSRARDFARLFSNAFSDSFDFVAFVLDSPAPPPAFQNSNGTLEGQYYPLNNRLPTRTRRMLGAIVLTSIGSQGGMVSPFRRGTILHEFMHEWGNGGTIPSTGGASLDVGSHWGFSSVGGILGGYYGPSGVQNAGTNAWIARGAPRTCLSSATPTEISTYCSPRNYFSTATWLEIGDFPSGAIEYGPLERYVAGFMPLSSLPSITYAQNGAWLDQPNGLFSATGFVTLTPSEIVARMGSRAPNYATSQKNFRVAVVVLTPNALVGSERLQDLNSVLTEFSRDATPQWSSPNPNVIWLHNFYTATRGVASIRAGNLSSEFR